MSGRNWQLASLAALGLGLVSVSASAASGVTTKTTPVAGLHKGVHSLGGTTRSATTSAAATAVHQAHTLLANANHDYDGHRAKAAAHVTHALRELGGHHHAAGAGNGAANKGNGNKVREPQAQSDEQLKQAMALLSGVRGQIPNAHKAHGHIQAAITELNTALKIR